MQTPDPVNLLPIRCVIGRPILLVLHLCIFTLLNTEQVAYLDSSGTRIGFWTSHLACFRGASLGLEPRYKGTER